MTLERKHRGSVEKTRRQRNSGRSPIGPKVSQRFRARETQTIAFVSTGGTRRHAGTEYIRAAVRKLPASSRESFGCRKIEGDGGSRCKLARIMPAHVAEIPADAGKSENITVACRQAARILRPLTSSPSPATNEKFISAVPRHLTRPGGDEFGPRCRVCSRIARIFGDILSPSIFPCFRGRRLRVISLCTCCSFDESVPRGTVCEIRG